MRRGADVATKVDSFLMSNITGRKASRMHKVHARITMSYRGAQPLSLRPILRNS